MGKSYSIKLNTLSSNAYYGTGVAFCETGDRLTVFIVSQPQPWTVISKRAKWFSRPIIIRNAAKCDENVKSMIK